MPLKPSFVHRCFLCSLQDGDLLFFEDAVANDVEAENVDLMLVKVWRRP